jgi:DNA adenine methylase
MTYDNCDDVKNLSAKYGLNYTTIPMTTTHLLEKEELIISDNLDWMKN